MQYSVEHGVKLSDGNSGEESFYDMGGDLAWLGPQAEHVSTFYDETFSLGEDTTFPSWAPSTTAKAIMATKNAGTYAADMVNYEYHIRWRVLISVGYDQGTALTAAVTKYCASLWQSLCRRPDSLARIADEVFNHNYCTSLFTAGTYTFYNNASGAQTFTTGISYGLYAGITAATFSSSTSDTPTVTLKTPAINARCSSTYLTTSMAEAIDEDNTPIRIIGDLYRVPVGWSAVRHCYEDAIDVCNNGL